MFSINGKVLADIGFFINLDESTDRLDLVNHQTDKFNIKDLHRFPALKDELRQYSCTKSHRAIFEYALNNNLEHIFILEDDFHILDNPSVGRFGNIELFDYISYLSNYTREYDVLMFGCNPKKQIIPINSYLGFNTGSTGSWAYSINKRTMRYILDNYNYYRDYMAIDDILSSLNYKGFKAFTTIPQIIAHADGVGSTLQPNIGTTHYSTWINGNWDKHLYESVPASINSLSELRSYLDTNYTLEKNLTILITGHASDNWLYYLRYLLKTLSKETFKCRFIVCYDSCSNDDKFNLSRYFRDIRTDIYPSIEYVNGGLISSLKKGLSLIQTPYFLWLEHDWVFLQDVDLVGCIKVMEEHSFINSIWFNKSDNQTRAFEICNYGNNECTPFDREHRVKDLDLVTTCRWSNNPAIHRTEKMKGWFEKYIDNEHVDIINQRSHNIEEKMIDIYRNDIIQHGWDSVRDNWGTFLYGNVGDQAYVGHTDASARYLGISRSDAEINGSKYMQDNPLMENE